MKTCCRCGAEMADGSARVCSTCRKPRVRQRRYTLDPHLTFRERQVAALVAEGLLNKEIGWKLALTEGTVKEYLNRIFRKLALRNRTELAVAWTGGRV